MNCEYETSPLFEIVRGDAVPTYFLFFFNSISENVLCFMIGDITIWEQSS